MAGLLSGLESLGLGNLESSDIFAEDKSESKVSKAPDKVVKVNKELLEEDLIYDREFTCPVCNHKFTSKIMKSNRAKLIGTDDDLKSKYENIESGKYDVLLCDRCGYAALGRYFQNVLPAQAKLIKENISTKVKLTEYKDPIYSYDQALERYKLALANAVVKRAKSSEKAYICLKTGWVLRGQREEMENTEGVSEKTKSLKRQENEYLQNAYKGLLDARQKESFPIAGMDPGTLDYLLAQLAFRFGDYDSSMKLVGSLLTSASNERIKNKARDLKEQLLAVKKS